MIQEVPSVTETQNGIILQIHVKPRSKRNAVLTVRSGFIVLQIQAPPVDEKANTACIKFLASFLGLPPSSCKLLSGKHSKEKRVSIHGILKENFLEMWNNAIIKKG